MNRDAAIAQLAARRDPFDIVVIGGGASGAGIALDAASRGLDTLLLEDRDFGSGTSSRSTKIIHGGVRYLAQAHLGLVKEALRERAYLLQNAPHLVTPLAFIVPAENIVDRLRYGVGLKLYDYLSGAHRIENCAWLNRDELPSYAATLTAGKFRGGMRYYDAQFDDARLLIELVTKAIELGALALNYAAVTALEKDQRGKLRAVIFHDRESGRDHEVPCKTVVNATGPVSDSVLRLDEAAHADTIQPSQGTHIVVGREFLPQRDALLMPRTPDGRVMFAIPWLDHTLIGTTDTPVTAQISNPIAKDDEVEQILAVAGRYLEPAPTRADILSVFAGIRPLARAPSNVSTAKVSREHRIDHSHSGVVSISGGKWTTYRLMAEQCVDAVAGRHHWHLPPSRTRCLALSRDTAGTAHAYRAYGDHAHELQSLVAANPELGEPVSKILPYQKIHCVWAIHYEMARTVEDILARRTRALFLNVEAALEAAPTVARLLAKELNRDDIFVQQQLETFTQLAESYKVTAL